MANYVVSDISLGSVADAIRTKGGTSAPLTYPQGFIDAIDAISGGGDEPIPDDGNTRIWIHIADGTPDNRLTFYLRFTASTANNTTVDWGDGTVETLGSTTATNYEHKYAGGGDYVIVMTINSGKITFEGDSSNSIFGKTNNANEYNKTRIYKIAVGINCIIGVRAFTFCNKLRQVVFPDNITNIPERAFFSCRAFDEITIPNSVKTINASAFNSCYDLNNIIIPDSVISIGDYAFQSCMALTSVTISQNISQISAGVFFGIEALSEIHLKATTPPTLANANAFNKIPSDCIIYVPQGSLNAYKTATNWSTYASKMQEEPT